MMFPQFYIGMRISCKFFKVAKWCAVRLYRNNSRGGKVNANTDYFFLCFAVTLLMAVAFDAIMKKLDAKLFTPKQKA